MAEVRQTVITIEGNIGAGKSLLGSTLKASGLFDFVPEPVDQWRGGFASNLLGRFYSDPKRWGLTFQLLAFITRAKTWSEVLALTNHSNVVLERSIFSDRHVFARAAHDDGNMDDAEFAIYNGMWEWLASNWCIEPNKIIYLRASAETCSERIAKRGRGEESAIPIAYLKKLEDLHDLWLLDNPLAIVLDGEKMWTARDVYHILLAHGVELK